MERSSPGSQNREQRFPRVVLWAWEHPQDLSFLDPQRVGVAFLAATVILRGESVEVLARLQSLQVPPGTFLMATVRIETPPGRSATAVPSFSRTQDVEAADAIAAVGRTPEVQGIQIDFDASASGRAFYRRLLNQVRRRLPPSKMLSMTALASWCVGDNWLAGLPVDEAVPMLFRMGPERREILLDLAVRGDFASATCHQSVGISTDEPLPKLPSGRRIYVFKPGPWTRASVEQVLREVSP